MPRAWHDRPEKMDCRRLLLAGFRRARSDAQRYGAAHRPRGKGGRRPGGPGGPQMIARTVCQRASEGRKLEMIGAGRKREAGADHSGAQTACTRQPGGERASTGLRAVEGGKGIGAHRAISEPAMPVSAGATSRGYKSGRRSWRLMPVAASTSRTAVWETRPARSHSRIVDCRRPTMRPNSDWLPALRTAFAKTESRSCSIAMRPI